MRQVGHSYQQFAIEDVYDAIVIGSGMGSLTAAALLAKHAGRKVLVLERHYTAGGFTHVFRRPNYEWDVGVHYIGGVGDPKSPVRAAFDHVTEGRLGWSPMPDVYDRILIAGRGYDFPSGIERFRERIKQYFPDEAGAIDQYIAAVCAASAASGLYFAEKAIPAPIARLIGPLLRRRFLRYADRTTAQVLGQFTGNRELIAVLTGQWGDYGLPPGESSFGMHAMIAYHYFGGAWYPVGGASEIAAGIAPVIERAGGQIVVSAEVSEILIERGCAVGVRMADGRELKARTILSDVGAYNTFAHLLPGGGVPEELKSIPISMSHACLYVGLKREAGEAEFGDTNLWIYDGPDHDAAVERYSADPSAPFPAVFISFPSAKDPTFPERYPGCSTIEVVAPMPYGAFERWADTRWKRRGTNYEDFKNGLAARLRAELERHVPATRGKIDCAELSTPLSTRHFSNYAQGEIYGYAAVPARFRARSLGARTHIRGLYLTGQDAGTAGVTGALFSGAVTASLVLGRNLVSRVTRPRAGSRT
jgi:all-trans-retinol 13,14-reductase